MSNPIDDILQQLRQFRDERDWAQFHNSKDLALAISIEAAELNEVFLWKKPEDADPAKVREELADVLLYAFQLADKYGWDIPQLMHEKMMRNAEKHPATHSNSLTKQVLLNTSEQVYTVLNEKGELINLYGNTGYGYIEVKAETVSPTEKGSEKSTKLARIKGTPEILNLFVKEYVLGDKVEGGIVIKEFLENETPNLYKDWLDKKKPYEEAVQEYLKFSLQTKKPVIVDGQRVLRFGEYLPVVPKGENDLYIL